MPSQHQLNISRSPSVNLKKNKTYRKGDETWFLNNEKFIITNGLTGKKESLELTKEEAAATLKFTEFMNTNTETDIEVTLEELKQLIRAVSNESRLNDETLRTIQNSPQGLTIQQVYSQVFAHKKRTRVQQMSEYPE